MFICVDCRTGRNSTGAVAEPEASDEKSYSYALVPYRLISTEAAMTDTACRETDRPSLATGLHPRGDRHPGADT